MPADTGFADVPAVGQKRQEHKERAQETLALGNPGDALDVEGMHREKRGDEGATPKETGGGAQQEKQEHHVEAMQNQAGGVMTCRIETEDLHVGHMANPG